MKGLIRAGYVTGMVRITCSPTWAATLWLSLASTRARMPLRLQLLAGDQPGRQGLLQWLTDQHRARFPEITEAERVRVARGFMSEPAKLGAALVEMEQQMYEALCQLYRVCCLSGVCDSP
jgi:hypothetical protein